MSKIGNNVKELREHFGMTIKELSTKSSVGQSTISEIETGKATNPKSDILTKIANAFNIPIDLLFQDDAVNLLEKPLTKEKIKEWDDKNLYVKEEAALYETGEFSTPQAAMQFILKQPAIMGFGGFDINKMTDKEVMDFANELLNQLKLLGYKYSK